MGINLFSRNCGVYNTPTCNCKPEKVFAPNPNPARFNVIMARQVGRHLVAKIKYPDCKNYEGMKICLFLNTNTAEFMTRKVIDPHFEEHVRAPFARFRPDEDGWNIAVKVAENIK